MKTHDSARTADSKDWIEVSVNWSAIGALVLRIKITVITALSYHRVLS
jgi:hypothetical protein